MGGKLLVKIGMNCRFLSGGFLAFAIFISGCASPKPFTAIQCPPDKALVYAYWPGWTPAGNVLAIDVDGTHAASLHPRGYYPLLLPRSIVQLGYAVRVNPIVPYRVTEPDALTLTVIPGETYYVAYRPWGGSWKPKLVLMDKETGQKEIAKCTLGEPWK